ncbi:MAG: GcrA family cell cycle regulator [Maricaulaceae bacterium]
MAWTDDRVETLKRLWAEGLSASQIAKQLGGVTRNAVIGKVHRLGLSGRATPSRPVRRTAAARVKPSAPRAPAPPTAVKPVPAPVTPPPPPLEPAPLENGNFATVLTLSERICKWPIGDPTDPNFRFCGRPSKPGSPYCEAHARMAYQPASKKRKRETADADAALDAIANTRRNWA